LAGGAQQGVDNVGYLGGYLREFADRGKSGYSTEGFQTGGSVGSQHISVASQRPGRTTTRLSAVNSTAQPAL
jgi:hypothetical protein